MEWLTKNLGQVVGMAVFLLAGVGAWYTLKGRVSRVEERQDIAEIASRDLTDKVNSHQSNTSLHIDPHRDDKRWDDFKAEIMRGFEHVDSGVERLEKKIERLMIHVPPPTGT